MNIQIEKQGGISILNIPLENLDAQNSNEFKRQISDSLDEHPQMIFDLSGVQFIDSSGLGAILSILRRLKSSGGDLKLCCLTEQVKMLFKMVRMNKVFDVFENREDAVKSFDI